MGRAMSIGASSPLVVLPVVLGLTLRVSELPFATRAMSRAVEIGAPFRFAFLSAFSVPRSKHPRPSDARSPFSIRYAPLRGADSFPIASPGPLPQIQFSRLGSGSRRHTLRASMYRTQRTNQKKRS
jgi:hypothetical protein